MHRVCVKHLSSYLWKIHWQFNYFQMNLKLNFAENYFDLHHICWTPVEVSLDKEKNIWLHNFKKGFQWPSKNNILVKHFLFSCFRSHLRSHEKNSEFFILSNIRQELFIRMCSSINWTHPIRIHFAWNFKCFSFTRVLPSLFQLNFFYPFLSKSISVVTLISHYHKEWNSYAFRIIQNRHTHMHTHTQIGWDFFLISLQSQLDSLCKGFIVVTEIVKDVPHDVRDCFNVSQNVTLVMEAHQVFLHFLAWKTIMTRRNILVWVSSFHNAICLHIFLNCIVVTKKNSFIFIWKKLRRCLSRWYGPFYATNEI